MRWRVSLILASVIMFMARAGAEITQITDVPASGFVGPPSISADGRYVTFTSNGNLANLNPVPIGNIFVYEVPTGVFTRITANGGDDPTISANGRWVAFSSSADYALRNADGSTEIFRYDRVRHRFRQLTRDNLGDGDSTLPVISGKGRQIAFQSNSNVRRRNPDLSNEVALFNRGGNIVLSNDPNGDGDSLTPVVSAAGDFVVFQSSSDLVGRNADLSPELMLYDVKMRHLTQVTNDPNGDGESSSPAISGDSHYIVFISSSNVDGLNPDGASAVYLMNRPRRAFSVITSSPDGVFDGDTPSINDDGRYIVFVTSANVTAGNPDHNVEIVVHDRVRKTFTQVTTSASCSNSNPRISGDGTQVCFVSRCDLTGNNADQSSEAFLADNPLLNLEVHSAGPVSLAVRDPNDLVITPTSNFIPRATYAAGDFDGDGVPEARVTIPQVLEGPYQITVSPDAGAAADAPVTVDALLDGVRVPVTADVVANLGGAPFSFNNQGFSSRRAKVVPLSGLGSALTLSARLPHVVPSSGRVHVTFTDSVHAATFDLGPIENFIRRGRVRRFKGTVDGFATGMRVRMRPLQTTGISFSARNGDLSMFAGTGNVSMVIIVQIGSDTTVYHWRFTRTMIGNLLLLP